MRWMLALLLIGCGGGGGDAPDGGPQPDGGGPVECPWQRAPGSFAVSISETWGGFGGAYRDLPWPMTLAEELREGDCAYYGPANAFCEPACTGNDTCVAGDFCQPYPTQVSVGHISVSGTTPALELEPQAGFSYYTTESYPGLFGSGDTLTLAAAGAGDVDPFEVTVRGVAPLTVPWEQVTAHEGQDLEIAWDTADSPEGTVVFVHMDSDHHGIQAYLECTGADDGSLTVPAAVLDRLIEAGETGIGTYIENAWITRAHASAIDTDAGCLSFRAESQLQMGVETIRN